MPLGDSTSSLRLVDAMKALDPLHLRLLDINVAKSRPPVPIIPLRRAAYPVIVIQLNKSHDM
jgi:hypothetical protein